MCSLHSGALSPFSRYTESDRFDVSATLNWEVPVRDWEASLFYSYGENGLINADNGAFNYGGPEFQALLASSDPAEAFNPFGDGTVQRDLTEFVETRPNGSRTGEQKVAGLSLNGSLFDMAGGAFRWPWAVNCAPIPWISRISASIHSLSVRLV